MLHEPINPAAYTYSWENPSIQIRIVFTAQSEMINLCGHIARNFVNQLFNMINWTLYTQVKHLDIKIITKVHLVAVDLVIIILNLHMDWANKCFMLDALKPNKQLKLINNNL